MSSSIVVEVVVVEAVKHFQELLIAMALEILITARSLNYSGS